MHEAVGFGMLLPARSTRVEVEQDKFRHETGRSRFAQRHGPQHFTIHCFPPRQAEQTTLSLEQDIATQAELGWSWSRF